MWECGPCRLSEPGCSQPVPQVAALKVGALGYVDELLLQKYRRLGFPVGVRWRGSAHQLLGGSWEDPTLAEGLAHWMLNSQAAVLQEAVRPLSGRDWGVGVLPAPSALGPEEAAVLGSYAP